MHSFSRKLTVKEKQPLERVVCSPMSDSETIVGDAVDMSPQSKDGVQVIHRPRDEVEVVSQPEGISWPQFIMITVLTAAAILCLFLGNMSYFYGSTYRQASRYHALNIMFVDYEDGGVIGGSVLSAYQQLESDGFPTLEIHNSSQYQPADLYDLVKQQKTWAAIYVQEGASDQLAAALSGQPDADYDYNNALVYIWNEVHSPTTSLSIIRPGIIELILTASTTFQASSQKILTKILEKADEDAYSAFVKPIGASEINVKPAAQATNILWNSVSMAIPIIQQLFFIMAFDRVCAHFNLFARSTRQAALTCLGAGLLYTFLGGLVTTSYFWAFRDSWVISGVQFVQTWMVLWLTMHTYYCLYDAASAFVFPGCLPLLTVTFIFINISTTNSPVELSPGFYRWGQALPAFNMAQLLSDVWTGGDAKVYQAVPVLLSWWVVAMLLAAMGFKERRRVARGRNVMSTEKLPLM
jgi:hypothetical protein